MLEYLPNLRAGLLIISFVIGVVALLGGVVVSVHKSSGDGRINDSQWIAIVVVFISTVIFGFGWAMPQPIEKPEMQKPLAAQRLDAFTDFNNQCLRHIDSPSVGDRTDCTYLARNQADISLGIKPLPPKLITRYVNADQAPQPTDQRDKFTQKFDSYKDECLRTYGDTPSLAQRSSCAVFAEKTARSALGLSPLGSMVLTRTVATPPQIIYREKPNQYKTLYDECMSQGKIDSAAARDSRIKACHDMAADVVEKKL